MGGLSAPAIRGAFNTMLGVALLAYQAVTGEWHWIPSGIAASALGLPVAEIANAWVLRPFMGPSVPPPGGMHDPR